MWLGNFLSSPLQPLSRRVARETTAPSLGEGYRKSYARSTELIVRH